MSPPSCRGRIATGHHRLALPEGAWLAPGFIDLQVNGGGDVLFNDARTKESISTIRGAPEVWHDGLLHLISDTPKKTIKAIAAVATLVDRDPSVLGIHLEGPFLSPGSRACTTRARCAPTKEDVQALAGPRRGDARDAGAGTGAGG